LANRNLPTHYRTSTLVKWVAEFRFGKCRQAYFFLKVSDIIGKERICQPIIGHQHYDYTFSPSLFQGNVCTALPKEIFTIASGELPGLGIKKSVLQLNFCWGYFFRQSPNSKKGLPAALCLRKKREITSYRLVSSLLTLKQSFNDTLTSLRSC